MRGPDPAEQKKMWKALAGLGNGPQARRDRAAVTLLFDLGLRRAEVFALAVADLDLPRGEVWVKAKGHREKQRLTLTAKAVRRSAIGWRCASRGRVRVRPPRQRGCAPGAAKTPLTGDALARTVANLGIIAALPRRLRPHGIRHAAITAALDETNGNVREVAKFSRHKKVETLMQYDDQRGDVAGDIAKRISERRK